jgi:hypothetical protein
VRLPKELYARTAVGILSRQLFRFLSGGQGPSRIRPPTEPFGETGSRSSVWLPACSYRLPGRGGDPTGAHIGQVKVAW